jgi:hypothetical protein
MNIYILVEGKTELYVYPKWIEHILPDFTRVQMPQDANTNNYYIFGNMGFPCIIDNDLVSIINDENIISKYDFLVVCIDSDGLDVNEREQLVINKCIEHNFELRKLKVVVQHHCFETWCLGNRTIFSRNPQLESLRDCIQYYDVSIENPERMYQPDNFEKNSCHYHEHYIKQVFKERGIKYQKGKNAVKYIDETYFNQLTKRHMDTNHIATFQRFVKIFENLKVPV